MRQLVSVAWLLTATVGAHTTFTLTKAHAAEMEFREVRGTGLVFVTGGFEPEDIEKFKRIAEGRRNAVIALHSDGGSVLAGIEIGTYIRMRNLKTVVPDGMRCASACALAWLGGTQRFMGAQSQVGFHAAYRVQDGKPAEIGTGNAIIGAYLNRIGLSDRAIVYITQAPPDSMTWLNEADAIRVGIDIQNLSSNGLNPKQMRTAQQEDGQEKSSPPALPANIPPGSQPKPLPDSPPGAGEPSTDRKGAINPNAPLEKPTSSKMIYVVNPRNSNSGTVTGTINLASATIDLVESAIGASDARTTIKGKCQI